MRKGCLLYSIRKHANFPHLEYFIHRPFSPTLAPYPPSLRHIRLWLPLQLVVYGRHRRAGSVLVPCTLSSNRSTPEQTGALDVRYWETWSARSCKEGVSPRNMGQGASQHKEKRRGGSYGLACACPQQCALNGTAVGAKERAVRPGKQCGYSVMTLGSVMLPL